MVLAAEILRCAQDDKLKQRQKQIPPLPTPTNDKAVRRGPRLRCGMTNNRDNGLLWVGFGAAIKAAAGVLRCAQDDDVEQATAKARSRFFATLRMTSSKRVTFGRSCGGGRFARPFDYAQGRLCAAVAMKLRRYPTLAR